MTAATTMTPATVKPLNRGRILVWSAFAVALIAAPLIWTSSLGQTLLSQIGVAIHVLNLVDSGKFPLPVSLVPLAGGLGGMGFALLLGWVTTKKSGTTFAMITLGIGELVSAMSLMFPAVFGGEGGISGDRVAGLQPFGITFGPQIQLYYLIAAYTFVCTALMFAFTGTPLGRMLNAVRDNPERVEFVGYDTQMVRYIAFVIAGFFAGIAGGLAALNFEIVTSEVVGRDRKSTR